MDKQNAFVNGKIKKMRSDGVKDVLQRLSMVLAVDTSKALAESLGVSPQAVSSWKSRDSVPYAECVLVAQKLGLSLDWLLTGQGPMRRGEVLSGAQASADNPREQALLALWRELDEDAQREIQLAAEEKKRLKTLEQRLQELEAVVAAGKKLA
ncbi:helix-turn-helix domain-containing protein [Stutzerimonas stutzeri]|uniref:helix-turn-helix domain-containing protein n=1 Tax=Stutzerimonas stutzeri TaxID=316 RepID=UPI0021126C86|nr:helix-turn-helix domain-containing protein [Stutzerimonas stutzeri]UUC83838.1 helix-turn-helix domain-containing protein [Stutzerimonas stutzeri]